jgi:hypothetical protein
MMLPMIKSAQDAVLMQATTWVNHAKTAQTTSAIATVPEFMINPLRIRL